ncbi:hypothetical protein HRbin11_01380 [bacterium HR11]|nr:hypothetical protein HRbin11_01380 [bacterium HR11]
MQDSRAVRLVKTRMDSAFSTLWEEWFFKLWQIGSSADGQMVPKALGLILTHPASICLSADLPICRMLEKSCFPGIGKGCSDAILTNRTALLPLLSEPFGWWEWRPIGLPYRPK